MAGNQIRVAVWEYRNEAGKRRIAYFGDSVELTPDEYERAKNAGVFDAVVPEAAQPPSAAAAPPVDEHKAVPRPAKAHAKELWVEYAVSKGWDRADAEDTNKKDLVAALTSDTDDEEDDEPTGDTDEVNTSDATAEPDELVAPPKAGLLEAWQDYARAKGLPDEDIEGMEKQELIELLT